MGGFGAGRDICRAAIRPTGADESSGEGRFFEIHCRAAGSSGNVPDGVL